MLDTMTQALAEIREIVFDNAPPTARFAFSFVEDEDVGSMQAGPLFDQNEDFLLFETEVSEVRRAGVSSASPTRCWGELAITLHSKNGLKEIRHRGDLESVATWFAEKTIRGIRFRTFTPLSTSRVNGFVAYGGVLNFDFETKPKGY